MRKIIPLIWISLAPCVAHAALDIGAAFNNDFGDGALNVNANTVIDLGAAQEGSWDEFPHGNPGNGIYDPEQWAIVYRYTSVNISFWNLNFINHPSNAPVVWLVQGDVHIAEGGRILLNGSNGTNFRPSAATEPGPGGFRGGHGGGDGLVGSAGFGPGGGGWDENGTQSGGSYGTPGGGTSPGQTYGNPQIVPLIGGSGGSGDPDAPQNGGAGGGAILIACNGIVAIDGAVEANGGFPHNFVLGGGSGGAIRIVADTITGNGTLSALGGRENPGLEGAGRIRIESNGNTLADAGTPLASIGVPTVPPTIFPNVTVPRIRSISLGGTGVPVDPRPGLGFPGTDLSFTGPGIRTLVIAASNVDPSNATQMRVRVVPKNGGDSVAIASPVAGDITASTWEASVDLPEGVTVIQVHAVEAAP